MASEPNSLRRAKLTPLEREAFLERFDKIASGQPAGRLRFQTKRLLWLAVVRGTYSFKRLFDIGFSAILLVSLALFFLLIAILIKLESPGPVFFQQTRVGRWGRTFQMWI